VTPPKWFMPVAIIALIWNLLGCLAYLGDVMLTPEMVALLPPSQQEMYAARTAWSVSATAIAVWFGAAGSLGLILRKKWSMPLLLLSLLAVIVQDIGLYTMTNAAALAGPLALVLQGVVLAGSIALLMLARTSIAKGWIPKQAASAASPGPTNG